MKIGVLSDTHIPINARELPEIIYKEFNECDLIIHAGDVVEMSVLDELSSLAELKAVSGNMDDVQIKSKYPEKIIFNVENIKIGVVHGRGSGRKVIENIKGTFPDDLDIIIFGHSHVPINKIHGNTLFFNPGSPTDIILAPYRSFGIIRINENKIESEIVKIP